MNQFIYLCSVGKDAEIGRIMRSRKIDPSFNNNRAIRVAAENGHLAVVEKLLQDRRVDPSVENNYALRCAAQNGDFAVVDRLLQDPRVDPSANDNYAIQFAAEYGHLAVVERLMRHERVDPSACGNYALRWAVHYGHFAVVDRLLQDDRVDVALAIQRLRPEDLKILEWRERLTEICVSLQDLDLPAWIMMLILKAAHPWTILPIHKRWKLVCTIKHFHDERVIKE